MKELEAKYLLDASKNPGKVLRRAMQELSWAGFLAHPEADAHITDTYFDTPGTELRQAGWSLRRREEAGFTELTCKQIKGSRNGLFDRQELNQAFSLAPDMAELMTGRRGPVVDLLRSLLPPEASLEPLFTVANTRRRYRLSNLENPRSRIELCFDRTCIDAKSKVTFAEIEAELVQGPPQLVAEIGAVLDHQPDMLPSRVSKYQRGLQAAGYPPIGSEAPHALKLSPRSLWVDLATARLEAEFAVMRSYEPLAWESIHNEGVHQMRVATRRMRAALRAFSLDARSPELEALLADIRWLSRTLGAMRDLDVHLEHLHGYEQVLEPGDFLTLEGYRRHLRGKRSNTHTMLREALASSRYARLPQRVRALHELTEQRKRGGNLPSAQETVRQFIKPQLVRVMRRGRAITDTSPAPKLHRLRIDVKRLRYQLEHLEDAYGTPLRKTTRRLSRLQTTLGNHQDAYVAMDQLNAYRIDHKPGKHEIRVLKKLLQHEADQAADQRARFAKRWRAFEEEAAELNGLLR